MEYAVQVLVATCRPPREDASVWVRLDAPSPVQAELLACQVAACHPCVVMPVRSRIVEFPVDDLRVQNAGPHLDPRGMDRDAQVSSGWTLAGESPDDTPTPC